MIIKAFEISKINLKQNHFFLFYGENEGHKNQLIKEKFKKAFKDNIHLYDENEVIQNQENFFNNISFDISGIRFLILSIKTPSGSFCALRIQRL